MLYSHPRMVTNCCTAQISASAANLVRMFHFCFYTADYIALFRKGKITHCSGCIQKVSLLFLQLLPEQWSVGGWLAPLEVTPLPPIPILPPSPHNSVLWAGAPGEPETLVPDGRIQGRWTQKWPSKISCGLGSQRPESGPTPNFLIAG